MSKLELLREKPHWSFSSINTYLNICSLQWKFRYIDRLEPESTSVPLIFGSAFHSAAEELAYARQNGDYSCATEVRASFRNYWNIECQAADKLSLTQEEFDDLEKKGQDMMETLYYNWCEGNIVGIARAFSVEIPGVTKPLIGEYDLLVRDDDGKFIIIDWKTSSRKWSADKADKDLQATAYAYSWYQKNGINPEVRFDVVTKTKQPAYEQHSTFRTEEDFQRLTKLVQTVERATEAKIFVPNEQSFYCGSCPYKNACKDWGCALSEAA